MNNIEHADELFRALLSETEKYMPSADIGKFVYSGYGRIIAMLSISVEDNSFLLNALNVAVHSAELGLQGRYIACAMLYHIYLDHRISEFEIHEIFGKDGTYILQILNSLITLSKHFDRQFLRIKSANLTGGNQYKQIPSKTNAYWKERNIRQGTIAFLALAQTPETAIIKLLERLYLLKNFNYHPEILDLQLLAKDTVDNYAPVAEAIGVWSIKSQLEDAAFLIIQPEAYHSIEMDLQERIEERQARINRAIEIVHQAIINEGIKCKIVGRPKHIYGIFSKLKNDGKSIREVNDILGIRIIVDDINECYSVLSILERFFHLVEGIYDDRKVYRDWIANPKPNQYQSIHTNISIEEHILEVQIRSQFMHDVAEYGVASHWLYRKTRNFANEQIKYQEYLEQIAKYRKIYEKETRPDTSAKDRG